MDDKTRALIEAVVKAATAVADTGVAMEGGKYAMVKGDVFAAIRQAVADLEATR